MAKINLEKVREAASRKTGEAKDKAKKAKEKGLLEYLFLLAAAVIDAGDEILDEMGEIAEDGHEFVFEVGAVFYNFFLKTVT